MPKAASKTGTTPKPTTGNAAAALPSTDDIAKRAYELYLQRGDNGGSPEQDWLRAVEEICRRQATA